MEYTECFDQSRLRNNHFPRKRVCIDSLLLYVMHARPQYFLRANCGELFASKKLLRAIFYETHLWFHHHSCFFFHRRNNFLGERANINSSCVAKITKDERLLS